ncbi:uncharacterized protein LOC115838260 [Nomascus leucogenys]|uniref:uncharacterized protein LOC115838260 n=1 Tax=Nomascus leucogenys TaxID=61853 RepID=UPI00122DAB29|nr:uncharacterized protein LOC115838260 [Nomascus leucogenys]
MASENLNKGGCRRRAAAAESCGGGFPRSVATTRALGDASPRVPPPLIRDGGRLGGTESELSDPSESGRPREGEREGGRGKVREGKRARTRAQSELLLQLCSSTASASARRRCTLRAVQRAHWSCCVSRIDPLYAHTHLHLHQCTLLPPPSPDNCWEKNKTTPTVSNKRQPRAPAIATSEKCTIARSFPRTEQNLKREDQSGRAGASLPSPHSRAASSTTPSRTKKFYYSKGKRVKCVPEEERRERTRGVGRLLVIRNLAKEERSSFFLCYLP